MTRHGILVRISCPANVDPRWILETMTSDFYHGYKDSDVLGEVMDEIAVEEVEYVQ